MLINNSSDEYRIRMKVSVAARQSRNILLGLVLNFSLEKTNMVRMCPISSSKIVKKLMICMQSMK